MVWSLARHGAIRSCFWTKFWTGERAVCPSLRPDLEVILLTPKSWCIKVEDQKNKNNEHYFFFCWSFSELPYRSVLLVKCWQMWWLLVLGGVSWGHSLCTPPCKRVSQILSMFFNKIVATVEIGVFNLLNFAECKLTFLTILLQPLWCGIRLQWFCVFQYLSCLSTWIK